MLVFDLCQFLGWLTQRAPDWWESPRFQAVLVAQSWFRQNGIVSSHPPAGNASRSAPETRKVLIERHL